MLIAKLVWKKYTNCSKIVAVGKEMILPVSDFVHNASSGQTICQ